MKPTSHISTRKYMIRRAWLARWKYIPHLILLTILVFQLRKEIGSGVRWARSQLAARQARIPAAPAGRILDGAHVLDAISRSALGELTGTIEERTMAEVAIVTVPGLQGMTVEDFANKLFNTWKIGKAGKNNGVLLLIAPVERKVRIEVGYGLEGDLPDGLCGEIIRATLIPAFKAGRFGPGAVAAVRRIGQLLGGLSGEERPTLTTTAARAGVRNIMDAAHLLTPKTLDVTANEIGLIRERFAIEVYVMTTASLDGRPIQAVAEELFGRLPLDPVQRGRAALLLVAAGERAARLVRGDDLVRAISQAQADRLTQGLARELAKGNVLGAFWSTLADLDRLLGGKMTMGGIPRTADQAAQARAELERGLIYLTMFLSLFVSLGAAIAAAGCATRTVLPVLWGVVFGGAPLVGFGLHAGSLGLWWPSAVLTLLAAAGAGVGWKLGRRQATSTSGPWSSGIRRSKRRDATGWSWGGSGGFGGSGGGGGGGGGGSSGGGGASGSW